MQIHHLHHLARATAGITNESQVVFSGLVAALRPLSSASPLLMKWFEEMDIAQVMVSDNYNPQVSRDLLESMLGRNSDFYSRYGYGIDPVLSWDMNLPSGWKFLALNTSLRYSPSILILSPTDVVLGNMAQNEALQLSIELVRSNMIEISELRKRAENWSTISATERMNIYRHIQIITEQMEQESSGNPVVIPRIEPFTSKTVYVTEDDSAKVLAFPGKKA